MSNDYNVYKDTDGTWKGKRQGASRASVTGSTQQEAFEATRELAIKSGGEVAIHRADNGQIREKHSYGNDPRNIVG